MGYPQELFVNDVDDTLLCVICNNVLQDVVMCLQCQSLFCRDCIVPKLEHQKKCYICETFLQASSLREPSILKTILRNLQIRCTFNGDGCKETPILCQYETHVKTCEYQQVSCGDCGQRMKRHQLTSHRCKAVKVTEKDEILEDSPNLKGYPKSQFHDNVSDTLLCSICQEVLRNAVECLHCQAVFCRDCVIPKLKTNNKCTKCEEKLTNDTLREPKIVHKLLNKLRIYCCFREEGCNETPLLADYEEHVKNCTFDPQRPVMCDECKMMVPQIKKVQHKCIPELRKSVEDLKLEIAEMKQLLSLNLGVQFKKQ